MSPYEFIFVVQQALACIAHVCKSTEINRPGAVGLSYMSSCYVHQYGKLAENGFWGLGGEGKRYHMLRFLGFGRAGQRCHM